jgi:hypothetical protein
MQKKGCVFRLAWLANGEQEVLLLLALLNCFQAIVLTRRTKHSRKMKETKQPQQTHPNKHKQIWRK